MLPEPDESGSDNPRKRGWCVGQFQIAPPLIGILCIGIMASVAGVLAGRGVLALAVGVSIALVGVVLLLGIVGVGSVVLLLVRRLFPAKGKTGDSTAERLLILATYCCVWIMIGSPVWTAVFFPADSSVREAPRRRSCIVNLKVIGLGLQNYYSVHGCFPPAYTTDEDGHPLHSWRVLILPHIEEAALYHRLRLDEPWHSPHNRAVFESAEFSHRCPYYLPFVVRRGARHGLRHGRGRRHHL